MSLSPFLLLPLLLSLASAQVCDNYGFINGSTCACPVGFGGSSCSQPACGGTIFQGSQRPLASVSTGSFANLTASSCSCQSGWTGLGCNVCQTANACQAAYSSVANSSPQLIPDGQNNTMVCSTAPRVYASSQLSCKVVNPTLQAIYPLDSYLNIMRTVQPSLTPLPNTTSFGGAGTAYVQLFYAGVEQFYCEADSCTQQALNQTQGATSWTCPNLHCTCRSGTSFCGAVSSTNLTATINSLDGTLEIDCQGVDNATQTATCNFKQTLLNSLFGSDGLALQGCTFGECVRQSVIDSSTIANASSPAAGTSLSGGVIAGLVVVGALVLLSLLFLLWGLYRQRLVRKAGYNHDHGRRATLEWANVSYIVPRTAGITTWITSWTGDARYCSDDRTIVDSVSGRVQAGQMMAILGPSGAGKTTLVEILAGKSKSAIITGTVKVSFTNGSAPPRIGFVPQQDILPPTLTAFEALLFAARLRLPEGIPDEQKVKRVEELMEKLGISHLRYVRIGYSGNAGGTRSRGISGGEMRRVSIGLELIADPDILLLDEPTSGLDSVSASRVASVLHSIAHDPLNPIPIIASIHQPSSQLYQKFDTILLLSHGRALYCGSGSLSPADHFTYLGNHRDIPVPPYPAGYNVADYLLEIASDPPVGLFSFNLESTVATSSRRSNGSHSDPEKTSMDTTTEKILIGGGVQFGNDESLFEKISSPWKSDYMATFLTQLQVLSGREWKILQRDKTLFLTHVAVASVLGVFCGGLYYKTGDSIAGFQSRVGCLFFLGALVAFSSLSALYNVVEIRPLFVRERSSSYYSPTAWLLSRFLFDVVPLRIIPTIIVSTITYWMTGLAPHASNFFKFLFILVLFTLDMTLFNFLLGTFFYNGGIAILLSALSALYQMTFAGFFVHLDSIPPVLRWLQWICPLKYTLEALSVNEVGSGLMINDTLQGVPVSVSASLIMQLLFGFGLQNYYRDVLVLFGFIAGFGLGVIAVVWWKVREKR
ncbi:hypothetical protein M378DRAFT_158303 [Amanita muscaria Koide BX008]|uniref:ABC transporter domain-containing protein n=1 Tax=Amanita muscaria (strain Koide BX008) TaxID=946122 RepID=A0A0C2X302_AMAMK|nr:hypothetical protein M378DRAFT_158303 [Amanita muscaria Koide BX008]